MAKQTAKKPTSARTTTPLYLLTEKQYKTWLTKRPAAEKSWLKAQGFEAKAHQHCTLPNAKGGIATVVCGAGEAANMWLLGDISSKLPKGKYSIANEKDINNLDAVYLGYQLGRYQFDAYKKAPKLPAEITPPKAVNKAEAKRLADSAYLARDMVNSTANDMNPAAMVEQIKVVGKQYNAKVKVVTGKPLETGWPAVHAVGKASVVPPALVDLTWGNAKHPKVTLVGKGVTFDTGGLNIKTGNYMGLMKKDMGGAAAALATAKAVMDAKLPVRLRLLIPTVENAIAGNAMRPSDVIQTRAGLTVEVGNTDAEGRLILCDALHEADQEKPDLLVDFATLTGAARVALGTDVPAFFTDSDALATQLSKTSTSAEDPLWRLPLIDHYAKKLTSQVADINNDAGTGYGGAISAALFLKRFVAKTKNWVHIDMMGWNMESRPGRPKGGEAHAVRAIYQLIKEYKTR